MSKATIQLGALIIVAAILALGVYFAMVATPSFGASVGGSYYYKNYTSANASSTIRTIAKGGAGELGTVTINGSTGSVVRLYDAATTTAATSSLNAIATIQTTTAAVTLTYDVALTQGLTVELPATFTGNITVAVR